METPPDSPKPQPSAPEPAPQVTPDTQPAPTQEAKQKAKRFSALMIVALLLVGLVAGGLIGYAASYSQFNTKLNNIQSQLQNYPKNSIPTASINATYIVSGNVSLSDLYSTVGPSVVVIQDLVPQYGFFDTLIGYSLQQGSGFVTTVDNQQVIVTNDK